MTLDELYTDLSYGELANLSMSGDDGGSIQEQSQPKIVRAANEALTRLYSRFILKEQDVLVELVGHITNYHLIERFTESTGTHDEEPYLYIKDLPHEPFTGDIIKILQVFGQNGEELALNDAENAGSLFTPQHNVLQVPRPIDGRSISVMYQAKHTKLLDNDPEQEILLPDVLHGALRAFIAYKVYSQINTQEATAKAQEHLNQFEAVCTEAIEKDLVNTSISQTNTKFQKRGFA